MQPRQRLHEIGLGATGFASPFFAYTQQGLGFRKGRLELHSGSKLRNSLRTIAAEEEQHTEVIPCIRIVRIQRNDCLELASSQVGPIILKEFPRLLEVGFDLAPLIGRGLSQRKTRQYSEENKCLHGDSH